MPGSVATCLLHLFPTPEHYPNTTRCMDTHFCAPARHGVTVRRDFCTIWRTNAHKQTACARSCLYRQHGITAPTTRAALLHVLASRTAHAHAAAAPHTYAFRYASRHCCCASLPFHYTHAHRAPSCSRITAAAACFAVARGLIVSIISSRHFWFACSMGRRGEQNRRWHGGRKTWR